MVGEQVTRLMKWMGTDGLLHFLVCYALMLTFFPFIGWWAVLPTMAAAIGKEAVDYFVQKDNNVKQVAHDFIFDLAGAVCAAVICVLS